MEKITMTFNHTSIEDALLLELGGISRNTADMMFECLTNKTNIYLGFDSEMADHYPSIYKPCWSESKLRTLLKEMGYHGMLRGSVEGLVPSVIAMHTMKVLQKKMEYRKNNSQ